MASARCQGTLPALRSLREQKYETIASFVYVTKVPWKLATYNSTVKLVREVLAGTFLAIGEVFLCSFSSEL